MQALRAGCTLLIFSIVPVQATLLNINFEGYPDGTAVTNQYPGLTFTRTTIITAGITLNEFEFPPRSGTNVAFDDGGFFTYTVPLTLSAFDAGNNLVAQTTSTFSSNLALGTVTK